MEKLIPFTINDLAKVTNHRSGEIKFGEKMIIIPKGVDKINMKRRMSPIERDIKKQAIMKEYQSGSAKSTKSAPKKPMAKSTSKKMASTKKPMMKGTK